MSEYDGLCPCCGCVECVDCCPDENVGEYINDPVVYNAFLAWCKEPAYDGQPNGNHMNTRTALIAEVAFKAGYDFAVEECKKVPEP